MSSPSCFRWYRGGSTVFYGMKSPRRASCSNKRCYRFPGFAVRFPLPYTFPTKTAVLPQLSGKSRKLVRYIRYLFPLFSFNYPDIRTAVPALYHEIRIPVLHRGNELHLRIYPRIHDPPPAFGASDGTHPRFYLMSLFLLFPAHRHIRSFLIPPLSGRRRMRDPL